MTAEYKDPLPCPFCGSPAGPFTMHVGTTCSNNSCATSDGLYTIDDWNTRATPKQLSEYEAVNLMQKAAMAEATNLPGSSLYYGLIAALRALRRAESGEA